MQGKKKPPAAASRRAGGQKTIALIGFAVLLVALFVIVAAAEGLGQPSVPSDAIAVVDDAPDGTITKEQFDRALTQTAARQGINQVPAATDPQYKALADAAQSDLLLSRWVLGEAEERGIEISDRQITDELEKVKSQQFGSEKAFQTFLDQSGFTLDEAQQRIELQLISSQIQQDVLDDLQSGAGGQEAAQQLAAKQQQLATQFQTEFQERWRSRTNCADGYLIDQCANGPQPQSPKADQIAPTP